MNGFKERNMKSKEIDKGWVIASMEWNIYTTLYIFKNKNRFNRKIYEAYGMVKADATWRKFKRQGYKCIKAKQTTEIE
jgi:hypothetical protein